MNGVSVGMPCRLFRIVRRIAWSNCSYDGCVEANRVTVANVGVHDPHQHIGPLGEAFDLDVAEALVGEARLPLLDAVAGGNVLVALDPVALDVHVDRDHVAVSNRLAVGQADRRAGVGGHA